MLVAFALLVRSAMALPDQRLAYGFEEGSGTAVADASPNATNATATSASWTVAGRYGNGLIFNGTSSRVRSTDSVALAGAFTLQAWVFNPSHQNYETVMAVGTSGSNRNMYLENGVLSFYSGATGRTFGAALPTNTWQHVALTYDGSVLRAYVNGVQRGANEAIALGALSGQLQVGALASSGTNNYDYFSGTIDEVRLYTRALSASELSTDMDAAIVSGGADTVAPAVSGGVPTGSLAAGTTQATLQVTTGENATCRYATATGTLYALMPNTFANTGLLSHSTTLTGLTDGSSYTYYVRCIDGSGNANPSDYAVTFSVQSPQSGGGTPVDGLVAYGFGEGSGTAVDDATANNSDATAVSSSWTTSGRYGTALAFNGSTARVRSNANVALGASFTMEAWVFNPSNQAYETVMTVGPNRNLYLSNGTPVFYTGNGSFSFGPALATNTWHHLALVSNGTTVRLYVNGVQQGSAGNVNLAAQTAPLQIGAWINASSTSNYDYFSGTIDEVRLHDRALTAAEVATDRDAPIGGSSGAGDTTAPALTAGAPSGSLPAGTTQATLQITTSENATCRYATTANTAFASMTSNFSSTGGTSHSSTVNNLSNGSSYSYYVRCIDASGNSNSSDYAINFSVANPAPTGGNYSLRFYGTQANDLDRVKVPLTTNRTIDVSGSFTLEWWMRTAAGNSGGTCTTGAAGVGDYDWITGNVLFDRDIDGAADFGKYGISLISSEGGRVSFGVNVGGSRSNICSTATVGDGQWHHVAATRDGSSGQICLYVDGVQSACKAGPAGDISYRDDRISSRPNSDPYFVMAAEKHDYAAAGTGFRGWLDEVRMSDTVRYTGNFTRPTTAFTPDSSTVALYHMDSGTGTTAVDTAGGNDGTLQVGGSNSGPQWSAESPF